jgi:hypothetical protein
MGGASGIDLAGVGRLRVLDALFTSFDLDEEGGHDCGNVVESRENHAWQKRRTGAVEFLAVITAVP